jgi:type IV secretion system protein VirB6
MIDGVMQWAFFHAIFEFLDHEIEAFRDNILYGMLSMVGAVGATLLMIWILWQGYQIITGRSRDSMMALVTNSLRSVLIVSVAMSVGFGGVDLYKAFTDSVPKGIMQIVTGDDDAPADKIDDSLNAMQAAFVGIDALATNGDVGLKDDQDRALMLTGVGIAGPSVVGGAMLLLYKIAMALFVGLGPLFILSLLFEQTKQLFSKWLYYGVGTMFSLAVLSFMVAVSMKMVLTVAGSFALQYAAGMAFGLDPQGASSMALQQGGLGLILTVLLVMTPPMAAQFFQGTLGSFSAYSQFGATGRPQVDASGRQVGYTPQPLGTQAGQGKNAVPLDSGASNSLVGMPSNSYKPQPDIVKTASNVPARD